MQLQAAEELVDDLRSGPEGCSLMLGAKKPRKIQEIPGKSRLFSVIGFVSNKIQPTEKREEGTRDVSLEVYEGSPKPTNATTSQRQPPVPEP